MKDSSYINEYFDDVGAILSKIDKKEIEKAIGLLYQAWKEKRHIFVIGNGGSASTATHFACDLNKYTSVPNKQRIKAISLEDNAALVTALVNDEGWENVYSYQLENLAEPGDVLVAVSVHGGSGKDKAAMWSQNLLKATKYIQDRKGKVLGLVGFDGGALKKIADVCVVVPIDSTPQVEGFHLVLTHLFCSALRDKISKS